MQTCVSLTDESITYPCETGIEPNPDSVAEGPMVRVWIEEGISHDMPEDVFRRIYRVEDS